MLSVAANKVTVKVECGEKEMFIALNNTEEVKRVYFKDLKDYPDEGCMFKYSASGSSRFINLPIDDKNIFKCGVTRVTNKITGKRVFYHTVVIETANSDGSAAVQPEVVHVKCSPDTRNHTVVRRNVLPAGFQEPENLEIVTIFEEKAPKPELGVGVRQNGHLVTGELNVSPGTPLQMEIFLDKSSAPIYGLLVTHMQVTDTKTQEETIIFNGCSVDPYLFENFNTVDGDFLTAKFRAFKFPESTYVQFRGTVNVCLDKCKGIECSDGVIGFGRKKRSIPTLPPDPNKVFEITITSFIKVNYDDESENFEELFKNQTKQLKDKKLIVGDEVTEEDNQLSYKTPESKPSNLGKSVIEELQYTAIVAETSSSSKHEVTLATLFVILLAYLY